ncbi:sigma-70 family RNA polymerase sigma factor [Marinobacter halophilus]|uniref:RNA polymerase subunit sigma n=1 Tax=Marinobacter halophilus TaxID=1323740 RepID=A0A2T1KIZ6_9GAMM|nr:sigma-70 family RNA polymerase sigma factor [Marinobacter halophilus]PSF10136.1 RNA polymerase subunit sigma [Marinobacter halophilus]GGC68051.1 RNA polymerase sigma factor [Marinobacter halophilus]
MTTRDPDQEELMALLVSVARSDRQAFQLLYKMISARMFGLCFKLAGQQELAEEALQDAFVQIWHHAGEYHSDRGTPLSWMLTIARYRTLDLMRSRAVRRTSGDEHLEHLEDQRGGPLDASLRSAGARQLTGCLDELSDVQRDSILLSYYRGFTHDELAQALSSPVGTVKSWIRRGLMALKRCLER